MEQNENVNSSTGISVLELLNKIIEKWYILAISVAVFLVSAFIYVQFFCTPMYSSTAKLFIFNTETAAQQQSTSEITISTYLARDYSELIADRTVLEEVIDNLKLDYSYSKLKNSIDIFNPDGTRILEISVKSDSAKLSKKIADEICKVSQEKIVDLMGIGRVNIISEGYIPANPSSPILSKYLLNALLISIVVAISIIFVLHITSDKIESPEDIEKYLNLSVLATIPYSSTSGAKKSKKGIAAKTIRRK